MVGADLYLRNLSGDVTARTGSDAILYLQPQASANINVQAGADILLRLPAEVDAELSLQGSSMESIRVDFPGVEPGEQGVTRQILLGTGSAKIKLTAGADLIVTSRADEWQSLADFDNSGLDDGFPGLPDDFHDRIAQQVQEATQRAVRATEQAQRHTDRAQRRVDAAMRRAEEKMRAAERRSHFMGVAGHSSMGRPFMPPPPAPPAPPAAPSEPVSDEERLTVLKMLQEKKISLQDADKLLAALDGK